MTTDKTRLAGAADAYSITTLRIHGADRIVAGPEGSGSLTSFLIPSLEQHDLVPASGGCMGFAPYPGRDNAVLAITGFLPVFRAEAAGVDLLEAGASRSGSDGWSARRILDLPFVHRIRTIGAGESAYLVAATLCGGKDSVDDWSQAGAVYAATVPHDPTADWTLEPVVESLHRNHGLNSGLRDGRDCLLVGADEGLLALFAPAGGSERWTVEHIHDQPVSEVRQLDIDGDGLLEIVVIEPFHGPTMTIYKDRGDRLEAMYSAELHYGHGLWAGTLAGAPTVIVGDRDGGLDLVRFRVTSSDPLRIERDVLDTGVGPASVDVVDLGGEEAVLAANVTVGEYALYRVAGTGSDRR